ncbi:hypothetical protein [Capnocytophaga cynodegmi]|uniref:hypothetical protein n=1 Tax=Capnocytophaga cynodegmi TaxID=28189 RepID=UPI0038598183
MKNTIKFLVFSIISVHFFSCKNNQKANQNFDNQIKKDSVEIIQSEKINSDSSEQQTSTSSQQVEEILSIKDTVDCVFKEEKLLSHRESTNLFVFNNFSVSLKVTDERDFNIIVNDIEYQTHIILDMGEIMVSNYRCDDKNVIIIHLEDYYGSIYFTYFYENENLFYLGSLSVDEPNVEKIGVQTKTFEIRTEKNVLEVISLLGGNLYDKKKFTQYEKIIKE